MDGGLATCNGAPPDVKDFWKNIAIRLLALSNSRVSHPFPKRLLVTGAAGIVASLCRPLLRERCEALVLTDRNAVADLVTGERFLPGDLTDLDFLVSAAEGSDGILHLGGHVGPDFTFEEVLAANVVGTRNVFEAARLADVPRVVYASSHHAVGFHRRGEALDHRTPPRPDSWYGLSKGFGEEIASYYADRHGIAALSIRIGFIGEKVIDERRLHTWLSPRDFVQLVEIGFTCPNLHFETVYGVSDNPGTFFDNSNATRLGYRPRDRALDHLADENLRDARPDPDSADGNYVGGHFVNA